MPSISLQYSRKTMNAIQTGMAHTMLASRSIGTTTHIKFTYPCRATSKKALVRFNHAPPDKPQYQPHPHTVPTYGATIQHAKHINQSPAATKADQKYIRQAIGILLYYARAVNPTLLVALSTLASAQAAPTENTMSLVKLLLDYVATQPDAIQTYKKSDMILAVHSNASYLSKARAHG
jgi:hypothetical protein